MQEGKISGRACLVAGQPGTGKTAIAMGKLGSKPHRDIHCWSVQVPVFRTCAWLPLVKVVQRNKYEVCCGTLLFVCLVFFFCHGNLLLDSVLDTRSCDIHVTWSRDVPYTQSRLEGACTVVYVSAFGCLWTWICL